MYDDEVRLNGVVVCLVTAPSVHSGDGAVIPVEVESMTLITIEGLVSSARHHDRVSIAKFHRQGSKPAPLAPTYPDDAIETKNPLKYVDFFTDQDARCLEVTS